MSSDAHEHTHTRLRIGAHVHRLDAKARDHYTTGCGLRQPKDGAVLTAAAVDCGGHGCKPRGGA